MLASTHRSRNALLQGDILHMDCIHLFNVCIALLRAGEVTRACIAWSRFWQEDVLMASDANWLSERLNELDTAKPRHNQYNQYNQQQSRDLAWEQMVKLDRYVLTCWRDLLQDPTVANEIATMEVNGLLFQLS